MKKVKLSKLIAPSFYFVHNAVKNKEYTHYWMKGGRGSTKSSFASIEIIRGIMEDPRANAMALRKVGVYLKESVYEQLIWAIDMLGVSEYWTIRQSPLELIYAPTGQRILFRGADKPKKIKSTKLRKGYFKYIWYEEVDEFNGMEEIRTINQSLMRGGTDFIVFYSFNPPKSVSSWVNVEVQLPREDRLVHHSTYLDVPSEWLGEQFIFEAEHLKETNPAAYEHEYLGKVTGTGGEVFSNVTLKEITDDEIASFDRIYRGIDWGYAIDPFHYAVCHYDATRRRLYVFYEIHQVGLSNRKAYELVSKENELNQLITCDNAEPKSNDEMRAYGLRIRGARKGPDSVEYGIKFLQDLEEIIIDPARCPNTAWEFTHYELDRDTKGNFKAGYPDKDNHSIDALRYALEDCMRMRTARVVPKPKWL